MKKIISVFMILILLFGVNLFTVFAEDNSRTELDDSLQEQRVISDYDYTYSDYINDNGSISKIDSSITVALNSAKLSDGALISNYAGKQNIVTLSNANSKAVVNVNVTESGYYCIYIDYAGLTESEKNIIISLSVDSENPFFEANSIELVRAYENSTNEFETDSSGDEIRPQQVQVQKWQTSVFYQNDSGSYFPYYFWLSEGTHAIGLTSLNGGVAIASLTFKQSEVLKSYSEYIDSNPSRVAESKSLILQGETATLKSSSSLYPVTDRTDCKTQPFSEKNTVLNAIGGSNWSNPGDWIEWDFIVETEGYYQIDLRVLQNSNKGIMSYRTVTINGEVPFAELAYYGFKYERSWYIETLHDPNTEEPFQFYFTPGEYTLRLEATTGELRDVFGNIDSIMSEVNSLYHSVIMITSTDPDIYRDYNLQKAIPGIEDTLGRLADKLDEQFELICEITGGSGVSAASIRTLTDQMRNMQKLPKTISDRISNFYSNISAVYAWLNSASSQPLEIDYIRVGTANSEELTASASFFERVSSAVKSFIYSFVVDYNLAGAAVDTDRCITVWMNKGNDQLETLKQLIESSFVNEYGIQVELKLVAGGVVEAVVAGTGPDIALNQGMYTPVDYAARGILIPLNTFDGFEELIEESFYPNSMIPYEFRGNYYALPETQDFCMMFYREDIINELGITLPNTWDELKTTMTVLARNNMEIGVQCLTTTAGGAISTEFPKNILTFYMQNEIDLYNENLDSTNLNTTKAINVFEDFTELYSKWGLPYYFDATNRFRTGEMPIMIASISTYNTLAISAPEIAGRWGMTLIPGTNKQDGTIDRTVEFSSTSTIIFNTTDDPDACWDFVSWWASEETQYVYSMDIESLLGASGRNLTANYKASERLPWDSKIYGSITQQWKMASTVPMVPGYYSVSRYLTNALSDTIINGQDARTVIEKYADTINSELKRKRSQIDALYE